MRPEIFRKLNVVFVTDGCMHCRIICQFIERINSKLKIEERIKVINCTMYQRYGIVTDPLILIYAKSFDGFPTGFAKPGIRVLGSNTKIESYEQFISLFGESFVIPEESEYKFKNDCEVSKGIFKNKVICK